MTNPTEAEIDAAVARAESSWVDPDEVHPPRAEARIAPVPPPSADDKIDETIERAEGNGPE